MSRAGSLLIAAAISVSTVAATPCFALGPPCPASKYPNTTVGTCSWFCSNCTTGGSMAYLLCNRPYGNCTTFKNCLGSGSFRSYPVSNPGGTGTYVDDALRYGYSGALSPRIDDSQNTPLEWGSDEGTTTTSKVLDEKHLMIAVPDGDATNYIYSQALRLEITVAPNDDDVKEPSYTGYVWRVIETEGKPPADADVTFLSSTSTSFPGVVVINLPNAETGNAEDQKRYIALLYKRRQPDEDGGGGVQAPCPPGGMTQPCWSRRQLRRSCRCR